MKEKIKIINVGSDILKNHDDIVGDCKRLLPKRAKVTSINVVFHDDSITTVCNFSLNRKEYYQIFIWKGGES